MWAQWINTALGIWLMVAPPAFGYLGTPAETSARIAGPCIATVATIAWWQVTRGVRWINVVLGAWLVIAPFLLHHTTAAALNSIIIGGVVIGLACVRGRITGRYGGGWKALFQGVPHAPSPPSPQRSAPGRRIE